MVHYFVRKQFFVCLFLPIFILILALSVIARILRLLVRLSK